MEMYKCVKGFVASLCDGDGFTIEECGFIVEEGSVWEVNEEAVNVLGADIHIENDNNWLELSKETLEEHFEVITKESISKEIKETMNKINKELFNLEEESINKEQIKQ